MQSGNLNNEVDLFALAKKVWSYKKFIFLVTGATLLIAGLYAFAATPWYKVVTLVENWIL